MVGQGNQYVPVVSGARTASPRAFMRSVGMAAGLAFVKVTFQALLAALDMAGVLPTGAAVTVVDFCILAPARNEGATARVLAFQRQPQLVQDIEVVGCPTDPYIRQFADLFRGECHHDVVGHHADGDHAGADVHRSKPPPHLHTSVKAVGGAQ